MIGERAARILTFDPSRSSGGIGTPALRTLAQRLFPAVAAEVPPEVAGALPRGEVARQVKLSLQQQEDAQLRQLNLLDQRDLVTMLVNGLLELAPAPEPPPPPRPEIPRDALVARQPFAIFETDASPPSPPAAQVAGPTPAEHVPAPGHSSSQTPGPAERPPLRLVDPPPAQRSGFSKGNVEQAKAKVQQPLLERMDTSAAAKLPRDALAKEVGELAAELLAEQKLQLNGPERAELVARILDDMLGLGPLEPLLADETVTDIMVNGPRQIYVERRGKLEQTDVQFRDNAHVMAVATRIVTAIGRRVDESTPLVDARLADGSRVNIIIPPLAIDGPSISIRKFAKKKITLDVMQRQENLSPAMATVLKIAARSRLNILISGGTGSGKTTLLNALSQLIDHGERIVTIEDAAELQLQQPHVVRLETRPPNLEGDGEITMRDLLKNSLRMRPDRIILGEIRGAEAVDMLQAMNTGHDGSLCTIHANRPREALTRLENMVGLSGVNLPAKAVRTQIASAVNMIVQVARMRDGVRRITHVSEVVGMEGEVITMQDLFWYEFQGEAPDGKLLGTYKASGIRPHFMPRAAYYGLEKALMEAV